MTRVNRYSFILMAVLVMVLEFHQYLMKPLLVMTLMTGVVTIMQGWEPQLAEDLEAISSLQRRELQTL